MDNIYPNGCEVNKMVKPDPFCENYEYEEDGLIVDDEWTMTARPVPAWLPIF